MTAAMRGALNDRQRDAVEHGDGPLLVLAGAGTGKTRVLVHRIAHLIEAGTPPWEILAVTFTNKAAGEMRERVVQLLGERARPLWIGTFHAVCARLLRRFGERIGLARDFQIFDDDDQLKIVGQLLKEDGCEDAVSPRSLLVRFDRAKNRGEDPRQRRTGHYLDDFVERIFPRYQERLRREQAVDFNDLLLLLLGLFDDEEAGPRLSLLFGHVLVDEFQDTNRVQYGIACRMAAATRNLTVVGDDDQSIYGWRGAEPKNLFDFERDFPETTVIRLEQNYRSTSVILDTANAVIERNLERHAKQLWTERAGGDPVEWYEASDDRGEAYWVAAQIARLVGEQGLSPGDVACLYRTHAQSRALEDQLRRHGLTPEIVGGVGFYERKEVKDVLAYLRLLVNPASDTSFERIVNTPARGIGEATVDKIRQLARARELPLLAAARLAVREGAGGLGAAARKRLAGFLELNDGLLAVQAAGASLAELAIQVVERSRYREVLEAEDSQEARDRLSNLAELVTVAADFDDEGVEVEAGASQVSAFLERLALAGPGDQVAATPEERAAARAYRVRLSTVHAAKGLEFPVVFLCGLEDGLFPSLRERDDQDEQAALEEERRLAYVAITRARDRLILSWARERRVWGEVRWQTPSRFLDDLPAGVLVRPRRGPGAPARLPGSLPASLVRGPRASRPPAAAARRTRPAWDEHDQRSWDDEEPSFDLDGDRERARLDGDRIGPGAQVSHVQFGVGRVIDASGQGRDRKLVIEFPEIGAKTVLARFVTPA
jgi:DNA helicase II / ATP-dependent DNA helicase PcrA